MEIWKDIIEYEGLYQISSHGRVKSMKRKAINGKGILRTVREKYLKLIEQRGYLYAALYKDGVSKWYLVHRLVGNAFIPNERGLPFINHKDENKHNNHVDNLEWCDRKYNNSYGTHNERVAKARMLPVVKLDMEGRYIRTYQSAKDAEIDNGLSKGQICKCCKGKRASAGGFKWKYKEL